MKIGIIFKSLLNEAQNKVNVKTLTPSDLHYKIPLYDKSGHDFKDKTIEDRLKFVTLNNLMDSSSATINNSYYIVLMFGNLIIGMAKVGYNSKTTSVIRFFTIDPKFRGNQYSRLMADALFKEAKNRNKKIGVSLYTDLGKARLQPLFNEYAKKYGVTFIDRKESDPIHK
jgi:hypothetical protein